MEWYFSTQSMPVSFAVKDAENFLGGELFKR